MKTEQVPTHPEIGRSPWLGAIRSRYSALARDVAVEVAVVGAGITGLTAAYLLARAGRSVIVLERSRIGTGATGHTTAHLTAMPDSSYRELIQRFGKEHARLVWNSGMEAIAQIAAICAREAIDCDLARVDGWLIARREEDAPTVHEEVAALQYLGVAVDQPAERPIRCAAALRVAQQARFNPGQYLEGLARSAARHGARIHEESPVTGMHRDGVWRLEVGDGVRVRAERVFVATHTPVLTEYPLLHGLAPRESFVVGARVAHGAAPDALVDDVQDPYHYYRIEPGADHDLVIFGGEDRRTGAGSGEANPKRFADLTETLREWLPDVRFEVTRHWLAEEFMSPDGLPIIGPDRFDTSGERYIATGFAGVGMTFGTLAARLVSNWVLGRPDEYAPLYSSDRLELKSAEELEQHARAHAREQQHDGRLGVDQAVLEKLPRNEGVLVHDADGRHVAVFRDDEGTVHRRSAICTHRGCIVRWNAAAHTWDCPCHGSRFEPTGEVRAGPAVRPLEETGT